jgi:hypothetical protein
MEDMSDITIAYEEEGELMVEELEKIVLQRGAWVVLLYRYRDKNRKTGDFGPAKACLRRYQKDRGEYKKRDSVNLSKNSATTLVEILNKWLSEGLLGDDSASD